MTDDTPAKRKAGRPTKYRAARAKRICDAIASGQTARHIAATQAIHWQTVCNWRDLYPEFAEQLRAAQSARAELMAEEILQIADDSGNDWIEKKTKQGRTWREPNNAAIQRSRLRVETRKYLMEKWSAHHYGAMQRLEVTGPGGGPILLEQIAMVAVAKLEAERAAAAGTGLAAIDDTPDAPRLTQHKPK